MGNLQLLLLVFGVIIVGMAVLTGFEAMDKKLKQSAADNLVDRNLSIATDAVYWKTKRDPFNGGNAEYTGLATDGMQTLFLGEETHNGVFKITNATATELEITSVSTRYPDIGVRTLIQDYEIVSTDVAYDGTISFE